MNNPIFGFNGKEKDDEIAGVTGAHYDFGAREYDSRIGRWWSCDAKASKYPFSSPFVFALNNPILFIDPNGKEVYLHGQDADATKTQLQKTTSLELKYNAETKQLTATGEAKTDFDKALLNSINDTKVKVNLITTSQPTIEIDGQEMELNVGGFGGSREKNGNIETMQYFNIKQAEEESIHGGNKIGTNAGHEIIESYIGGKESPGAKSPVGKIIQKTIEKHT